MTLDLRKQSFSTTALLKIALDIEEKYKSIYKNDYFDLNKFKSELNNEKLLTNKQRYLIWLKYDQNESNYSIIKKIKLTIDEINNEIENILYLLYCISPIYRQKENQSFIPMVVYKLKNNLKYLKLFGPKNDYELALDYVKNNKNFDINLNTHDINKIAKLLNFTGDKINPYYQYAVEKITKQKFKLHELKIDLYNIEPNYDTNIFGNIDFDNLQKYLNHMFGRNVKILNVGRYY